MTSKRKKKYIFIKQSVIECGKKMSNIYLYTLKKDLFEYFRIKENETKPIKQV